MTTIIKESVSTPSSKGDTIISSPVVTKTTNSETYEYLIYFLFGFVDTLLAFRLIFKLTGASASSGFVSVIYGLTSIFTMPFEGIFRRAYAPGVGAGSIFEPSTMVAIIVYALLAWGIVKLLKVLSRERPEA